MNEDDKLTALFRDFNPHLGSGDDFMRRLGRNLDTIEAVKRHYAARRARSRMAVVIAAVAGFVAGFLSCMAYPYLWKLSAAIINHPAPHAPATIGGAWEYCDIMAWMLAGTITIIVALGAYDLTASSSKATAPDTARPTLFQ